MFEILKSKKVPGEGQSLLSRSFPSGRGRHPRHPLPTDYPLSAFGASMMAFAALDHAPSVYQS